ncbi:hypothetical protein P389DRAFT_194842 [Cystobasidium minutum MCA 4210]|uniref:uncharacterized protein n=1 Tax=Cystobasidium minutum MCA 4210 TaxID=1397322 RepID=UPI0034CFBD4C|eukprot:jgi/Rhomi1/194842/gm1.3056_g
MTKANFKLGKGKLKSANATDTSFSSRSIALTQQSITRDNTGVPTTKRNLTLEDLQTHLKHYSSSTRKDALAGLRELFSAHRDLWESSAGSCIPILARMIGDEEQSVRKALLAFLAWYLPGLPSIVLQPHHSILLFFATSSMSHIYPDIRLDAVRALNIMLDIFPESIALPWWGEGTSSKSKNSEDDLPNKVLECYLSLIHIRSGVTSNGLRTDMSPASKALILSSLATFLRLSTAPQGPTKALNEGTQAVPEVPTWFMAPAFPTRRAYESYIEWIGARSLHATAGGLEYPSDTSIVVACTSILDQQGSAALGQISDIFAELTSEASANSESQDLPASPYQLLRTLLPILVSAFLDSGPTAFSPEAASVPSTSTALESAMNTITAVAEIARDLWRSALLQEMHEPTSGDNRDVLSGMEKLIAHMAAYFPFGTDELTKRSSSDSTQLQNLNITFCELVALVSLATNRPSTASKNKDTKQAATGKARRTNSKMDSASSSMSKYVTGLLQAGKSHSILSSGATVTPQMYTQLLPTIRSLLWSTDTASPESDILHVVVRHFLDLPSTSGTKKLAFRFVSRLLMLPDLCPAVGLLPFGARIQRLKTEKLYDEVIAALPRYLWELGTKDEDLSHSIIVYMRHATTVGQVSDGNLQNLATYMTPYFNSTHPKKGTLPGPWTKLDDEETIIAALETVFWLRAQSLPAAADAQLAAAVEKAIHARGSEALERRWQASLSQQML